MFKSITLNSNTLTDRLLRSWLRCKRKAWLDQFGDSEEKLWTAHRALQLDHQHESFIKFLKGMPGKGAKACSQGNKGVIGLRLKGLSPTGLKLEAHPGLLQKTNGESRTQP